MFSAPTPALGTVGRLREAPPWQPHGPRSAREKEGRGRRGDWAKGGPGATMTSGRNVRAIVLEAVPTQMLRCLRSTFSTDRRKRGAGGPGALCVARLAQGPVIAPALGALIRVWVPPPCLGLSPGIEVERREARGARIPRHSFDCHIREAGWPSEWQGDPGLFLPGSARGLSRVTASRSSRRDDQQLRGDAGPVCAGAQGAAPGHPIKADRTGREPHRAALDAPVM